MTGGTAMIKIWRIWLNTERVDDEANFFCLIID